MRFRELLEAIRFTLIKLPFIYLLILIGYILELLVELPWLIRYGLSSKYGKKTD